MQQWQQSLTQAFTDLDELLAYVEIPSSARQPFLNDLAFPLLVTREFASRMRKGDVNDPLLLQVLPQRRELLKIPGYHQDPLAEAMINPMPGLLHRYAGRVLLTLTAACPVHCRYCFRRYFPYAKNIPSKSNLNRVIDYIKRDTSIKEVIYSGGDPLLVHDRRLQDISQQLAAIEHVQRLRIHTRVPIFLPSRINASFLEWFAALPLQKSIVIHVNHPQEIDSTVIAGLAPLRSLCQLLNQSVLLAGINADAALLADLSSKLFQAGVLPYYLHQLDPVAGSAHFAVTEADSVQIMQQLSKTLPGYLVPKLVKTVPGALHKMQLF